MNILGFSFLTSLQHPEMVDSIKMARCQLKTFYF